MGKDPAILWYPNDWLGGTIGMTLEQKGAYMELLMAQFNRGHMTSHMIGQLVGQHWDIIKDKFIQDEDGLWYNKRLDDEKTKRKLYVESRVNNKKGVNQHTKSVRSYDHEVTCHMENENINEDDNINIAETTDIDKTSRAGKEPKHKHGEYGWVLLSDSEYQKLIKDHGEQTALHYITVVDESAQQTGNKNKWKDWNLTVRKAIKNSWGSGYNSKTQESSGNIFFDILREEGKM